MGESRMRQTMAPSKYPRVLTGEVGGEHFAPRSESANKGRTFVWGSVCDEIVDIEIDNRTDCNLISEGLLEPLGCEDTVRRFNGKLKGTFNGKERKVEALGYIRTRVGFGSFEGTFMLIVVSNRVLDSDVVLSAQGLAECHKLFVSHKKRALCHEGNLMEPTPVVFEKLPKTSMIMLDEETVGTKKKVSMWNGEESKKPSTGMDSERTTPVEPYSTTATHSRRSDNDDSSGSRMMLEAAEVPTEVNPKLHLIDGFVENLLVRMELEETTAVHMMNVCAFMILESSPQLQAFNGKIHECWDDQVSDVVVLGQAEVDVQIGAFTERLDVVVVAATEIEVDVVLSLKQLEGRHGMLLESPRGVLRIGREEAVQVITEDCEDMIPHHFEVVFDGDRNPEVPRATSKGKDKTKLAEPIHEGLGVLAEPVGKDGITSRLRSVETEPTARAETQCSGSVTSEGKIEDATEVKLISGRRTRSVETRRRFVNAFANGVYMDTELDDEIMGNLMRLDAYQTLQPRPAILQFNGSLIGRCDGNVRDVEVLGLISVEIKLGRLKRTFPAVLLENHEMDTDMVLSTRWMNECLGSFYDEQSKKFFTSSEPNSAVSFEWESCPRPQKTELAEESQTHKPVVGRQVKESRVVAPKNARKEVSESTPVETDDRCWMPIRAFTSGYVNNRAAKVELDPDTEWTLLSYEAYRSIGSEMPLRQAGDILETKTGVSIEVVGRASIVLQLGQFNRRTEVLVVDGLDVDLTLGLVWYEQNEGFVFDMRNEVLKTGTKCSSPIQVRFRCPGRPRFRVRRGMDSGRVCAKAAATTDSCDTVPVYHEGAGPGTEMTEIRIGESAMVDEATERTDIEVSETSGQENECKGMSHGSLREGDLGNCEPDVNSMERVYPTEMGQNEKSVDEHSEENAAVIGEVTSGKTIEVGESTCGTGLFPRSFRILSRPITFLLSHTNGMRGVLAMVGRGRREVTIAPGGNDEKTKGSSDGTDDDELSFDEDETADGFLRSGDNASAGGQMMIATVQKPDDNNMDELKTTWAEMCQEMTETTCEHRKSTKVWDERQNLLAGSRSEVSFRSSKRFRKNDDREWLGSRRKVGPRDVTAAYFHNLIDRWKKLSLFGEDDVDRSSAASEGEIPKQCWRPPDAMGESDNWTVPQQDYRHLVDRWKRQEER